MALAASTTFAFTILGDGASSTGSFDLERSPIQLTETSGVLVTFLSKLQLPSSAIKVSANGTVNGAPIGFPPGQTTVVISGSTMTVTLPFVPDAGTQAVIQGFLAF